MGREDLDPWRVVLHHLFGIDSREIPRILDRAGLAVDWKLSEKEDYSTKTRLAAYRPRIVAAYEALTNDNKLRVAYIVVEAILASAADDLDRDLRHIGWKIESGRLMPSSAEVSELFFPTGSQHDAYVEIRRIVQQAQKSIAIVDPYVDGTIFALLSSEGISAPSVRILTHKHPSDFAFETRKFQAQYPNSEIETRTTKEFHDRFVVVDGSLCWHIGCSIKDAGVKAFMISQVEDGRNRDALLLQFEESWRIARPIENASKEAAGARSGGGSLRKEFDILRRKILYIGITNEIPGALRELKAFFIEKGLVERPEFRPFFDTWLSSPIISVGAPMPNLLTADQIRQMNEDLRRLNMY